MAEPTKTDEPEGGSSKSNLRWGIAAGLVVVLAAVGFATKDQWDWLFASDEAQTTSAVAPVLDDVDPETEQLYRIVPDNGSSATYTVEERLAGNSTTASGTTTVMAGDIAVNTDDPTESRVGTVMINLEMLESDSALRDKRIRHDFLESTHFPMATFSVTAVEGLPASLDGESTSADITMTGDLTIKETTKPVTFSGTADADGDTLEASMSGTILMSDYDIGPIDVAGLVHTGNEVDFELELVAERVDPEEDPKVGVTDLVRTVEIPEGEFAETVQPILESKCVTCHTEGGPGHSTVEMDTAGQVAVLADDIKLVTQDGFMPPWPASDLSPEFEHDFSLEPDQIDAIAEWADAGGGLDVPEDTPLDPDEPPFEPIERDQVIPQKGVYVGTLEQKDDYRCFIHEVEDPEGDGEWVKGIGFEPDQLSVVHHSIIYVAPPEAHGRGA